MEARLESCEGHRDPCSEQCVEYGSKNAKRAADLMLMLGLIEAIDHSAMASSIRCYGYVSMKVLVS